MKRVFKTNNIVRYFYKVFKLYNRNLKKYKDVWFGSDIDVSTLCASFRYTIKDGFENNIDPHIMAGLYNIKLIPKAKVDTIPEIPSSITKEELFKKHNEFVIWQEKQLREKKLLEKS